MSKHELWVDVEPGTFAVRLESEDLATTLAVLTRMIDDAEELQSISPPTMTLETAEPRESTFCGACMSAPCQCYGPIGSFVKVDICATCMASPCRCAPGERGRGPIGAGVTAQEYCPTCGGDTCPGTEDDGRGCNGRGRWTDRGWENTQHLRAWINGGTIEAGEVVKELKYWLGYFGAEPARPGKE